jgi:NAD(P)-dependent dehydrogenase (short-subunit alcohol dehydrogenase family)
MTGGTFIDFAGRWVVLTGGSSGIGRAIALQLGQLGACVAMLGRNVGAMEEVAAMLPAGRSRVVEQDLGNCGTVGAKLRALASLQAGSMESVMSVNLNAAIEMARVLTRRDVMTEGEGALLFISSVYGWVGMAGQVGYSASKGALISAARAMAVELARRGVRVNTLSPGMVHTAMTEKAFKLLAPAQVAELESNHPLGPGSPEDVARAAAFLLAPESRWITGTDLTVDGGYTAR